MQMATFRASGQGGGNPAPTVSGINPTSGTANGGTAVTITGTGFLAGATVSLGGTAATGVTVVSSTSITATTAAHAAGAVNVVVTNTDAQSGTLSSGYTYTGSNPAPTVSAITPTSGTASGGTAVTITGYGIPDGRDGKSGWNGGDRCDRGEQHIDHGDDSGAYGGSRERGCNQYRRAERHADRRLYLYREHRRIDCVRAGKRGDATDQRVGTSGVRSSTDGREPEHRRGGME